MSTPPSGPRRFWEELKDRKVVRVAVAYAVVGWVVFEVAEAVFPRLLLPEWSVTLVLVMVLLGFPLALVLAWAFEVTPEGVRRVPEAAGTAGPRGATGGTPGLLPSTLAGRIAAAGGVLVLALTGGAFFALRSAGPELVDDRVVVGIFENQTGDPSLDPVGRMASDVIGQGLTRAGVIEVVPTATAVQAYRAYADGWDSFMHSEYRVALEHLDRALASDSTWVGALILAAVAHLNLGEPGRVEARLDRIRGSPGSLTPFQVAVADWIRAALDGDTRGAYRAASRWVELAPSGIAMYQVAYEALDLNRPREAVDRLTRMGPDRADMEGWTPYWGILTEAYHLLGEHGDELEAAREGRQRYPDRTAPLGYEAAALAAPGRGDELRALLDDSHTLPTDPVWEPPRIFLEGGIELRAHGHPDAARDVLNEAVEWYRSRRVMEDGRQAHRRRLGDALYYLERYDEARDVFSALSDADPEDVAYVGRLGMIAALAGDTVEARRVDRRLAAWEEPYLNGRDLLWRAYIAGGPRERERAVELLRRAFEEGRSYGITFHRFPALDPLRDYGPFRELMRPKG